VLPHLQHPGKKQSVKRIYITHSVLINYNIPPVTDPTFQTNLPIQLYDLISIAMIYMLIYFILKMVTEMFQSKGFAVVVKATV